MLQNHEEHRRIFGLSFGAMGLILVAFWTIGFLAFVSSIPRFVGDIRSHTDVIVVLTGGSKRLETGFELLAQKQAEKLFISGVYRGVELRQILAHTRQAPQELECCVEIGHEADSTKGNAHETAEWIAGKDYKSLRLVTANYHMPRSLLEFSGAMPDVRIIAHPVFSDNVKMEEWWRFSGTTALLWSEYNKYILVWLRQHLGALTNMDLFQ